MCVCEYAYRSVFTCGTVIACTFEMDLSLIHSVLLEQVTREVTLGNTVTDLVTKWYSKRSREIEIRNSIGNNSCTGITKF